MSEIEPLHSEEFHEGEHYLNMLGLGEFADRQFEHEGKVYQARDFLVVCGHHARPMLAGFEALAPDDPRREPLTKALQGVVGQYLGFDLVSRQSNE